MRTILALVGGIVLVLWLVSACNSGTLNPISGLVGQAAVAPAQGVPVAPAAQPTAAQANPSMYVGVPPENAAVGPVPSTDIGIAMIDGNVFRFDGGAQRWLGMWQTGKPQSPQMAGVPFQANTKVSCQNAGWVVFVDAVSFAMGGTSYWSNNPRIAEIACPFEETRFTLVDGQIGVVTHEWADWAWRDRVQGFERASGHSAKGRMFRLNGGRLTLVG